jgi:hypothetical protein
LLTVSHSAEPHHGSKSVTTAQQHYNMNSEQKLKMPVLRIQALESGARMQLLIHLQNENQGRRCNCDQLFQLAL